MENQAIHTLETAAHIFMAPPSAVTSQQRQEAEAIFLDFRKTPTPYQLCRDILERSSSDYVLFEAVGLLKSALMREWSVLSKADILSMRQFLFQYLLERNLQPYLRERILQIFNIGFFDNSGLHQKVVDDFQTISIIVKRGSIDDEGQDRHQLLTDLADIIMTSTPERQQLACGLIQSLLQEFAVTVKSSDVGILWETHFKLKKQFEKSDLKTIFRFAVGALERVVRSRQPLEGAAGALVAQLLCVAEAVLCWGQVSPLLPKRLIGALEAVHETDASPALRLSQHWRDTLLEPQLLAMFFELHKTVRTHPHLVHHSLTCLVQFASLSGSVLSGQNAMLDYYQNYIRLLLEMLSSIQLNEREMLGVSDMFRKLLLFFPIFNFNSLESNLPEAMLTQLTTFTCHCIRASALEEEQLSEGSSMCRDALGRTLDAWGSLLQDREPSRVLPLGDSAIEVFNTYLQCRLAPPAGTRSIDDNGGDGAGAEEEDERSWHSSTLQVVGTLSRRAVDHCIPLLTSLITDRTQKLEAHLQQIQLQSVQISQRVQMFNLFDDLHWLIMIGGYIVRSECSGETSTMPPELLTSSANATSSVDRSLRLLVGEISHADDADLVIALVASVLRLSELEARALQAGGSAAAQTLSPELSATISWFFCHWLSAYLMPDVKEYGTVSAIWEAAWGRESLGAAWIVNNLMTRVLAVLSHLSAEPAPRTQAIEMMTALTGIKDKQGRIASSEALWAMVAWERDSERIPGEVRKGLYRAFIRAAAYADDETRHRLLATTATPNGRLSRVTSANLSDSSVLADILDCYIGVAEGAQVRTVDSVFEVLLPALDAAPGLMERYHSYPEIVLPTIRLLAEVAKRMLCFLSRSHTNRFYESCLGSISVYSKWNSNKLASLPQDAEEDTYQDVLSMIDLLSGVQSKETLEMWDVSSGSTNSPDPTTCGSQVCLRGLRLLMPLVTNQLLAFPLLAIAFYRMIREIDPTQVCMLPAEDALGVLAALRLGLTAVAADVAGPCCDAIAAVAARARSLPAAGAAHWGRLLRPLAELLLSLAVRRELPPDALSAASAAVYAVACLGGDVSLLNDVIVGDFIASFSGDAIAAEKLQSAFNELVAGINFDGQRQSRLKFRDNFDKFLVAVHNSIFIL